MPADQIADTSGRRALITGVSGQDGSFLAELLLEKGYEVIGLAHEESRLGCAERLRAQVQIATCDLLRSQTIVQAIERVRPHEIYHLAAPSFIPESWKHPRETLLAIAGSTAAVLEAVRGLEGEMRVWVPASAAIYGDAPESPQREGTPCRPVTPYGAARLAAHQLIGQMRAHDGLHASSGIVFNHESERRPERFVTRRITRAAASVSLGLQSEVTLGDLDAVRDWSFAGDIMEGAWLMVQQDQPGDYVLASGVPHTVAEFAKEAFACVNLDYERYVRVDRDLVREKETVLSVGDPTRAREELGWRPRVEFEELVKRMVEHDVRELREAKPQRAAGA